MRKIVEIKNLVKSYGGKDYQTKVLKNINLDIYENDSVLLQLWDLLEQVNRLY